MEQSRFNFSYSSFKKSKSKVQGSDYGSKYNSVQTKKKSQQSKKQYQFNQPRTSISKEKDYQNHPQSNKINSEHELANSATKKLRIELFVENNIQKHDLNIRKNNSRFANQRAQLEQKKIQNSKNEQIKKTLKIQFLNAQVSIKQPFQILNSNQEITIQIYALLQNIIQSAKKKHSQKQSTVKIYDSVSQVNWSGISLSPQTAYKPNSKQKINVKDSQIQENQIQQLKTKIQDQNKQIKRQAQKIEQLEQNMIVLPQDLILVSAKKDKIQQQFKGNFKQQSDQELYAYDMKTARIRSKNQSLTDTKGTFSVSNSQIQQQNNKFDAEPLIRKLNSQKLGHLNLNPQMENQLRQSKIIIKQLCKQEAVKSSTIDKIAQLNQKIEKNCQQLLTFLQVKKDTSHIIQQINIDTKILDIYEQIQALAFKRSILVSRLAKEQKN